MKEVCRRCSKVTLGLSIALCVLGILLLVMGPVTAQMTAYSAFIENYEATTCLISTKSVVQLPVQVGCEDHGFVAVFWSSDKFGFVSSPTSATKYQADATARLNDYSVNMRYDCYCQQAVSSPVMVVDPLTCNVWPNCFLDINAVLEFKKMYTVHIVGQATWIVSFVLIVLFAITVFVGCILKCCSKRSSYEELADMQAKLDKPS